MHLLIFLLSVVTLSAHAEIHVITQAQTGLFLRNQHHSNPKNGSLPFLGSIGLEYKLSDSWYAFTNITHRSNVDIGGYEYNYETVNVGVTYKHCLLQCKEK